MKGIGRPFGGVIEDSRVGTFDPNWQNGVSAIFFQIQTEIKKYGQASSLSEQLEQPYSCPSVRMVGIYIYEGNNKINVNQKGSYKIKEREGDSK
jgi:hypothetical protein